MQEQEVLLVMKSERQARLFVLRLRLLLLLVLGGLFVSSLLLLRNRRLVLLRRLRGRRSC
jgi:hypothetical protein